MTTRDGTLSIEERHKRALDRAARAEAESDRLRAELARANRARDNLFRDLAAAADEIRELRRRLASA